MALGVYLNFEKEAKEVIKFYEQVFKVECEDMLTFGDPPPSAGFPASHEIKGLIMNASLTIEGTKLMFSDTPQGQGLPLQPGNNISLIIEISDEERLTQYFNELAKDGTIIMPLEKTFWADKYGYLIDKFGIGWQLSLTK